MLCKFIKKSMTSTVTYSGELRTLATHLQSGSTFETDAPTDNQGKGARFSPTDLIGTSLASCMITTMAIKAKDLESKLIGLKAETEKIMTSIPRRKIGGINIIFHWAAGTTFSNEEKVRLEEIAWTCPVKESIHPDIKIEVNFNW
jgi:putative redox protein